VPYDPVIETGTVSLFVQYLFYLDPEGKRGMDEEMAVIGSAPAWVPVALEG
jgi:hypothetical protein